ncbi:hypothetical protein HK102_005226 [Quaeritorhiza haematococci]|nr:hypothetical protein HK102_005226 [Quaeritorhiza haematococci]
MRFNSITLLEPPKEVYLAWCTKQNAFSPSFVQRFASLSAEELPPREAFCVLISKGETYECVVRIAPKEEVVSWQYVPGVQPNLSGDEYSDAERICLEDEKVKKYISDLGLDIKKVLADSWTVGYRPEYEGKRVMQTILYYQTEPDENAYAHPLDIWPVIDLGEGKVIDIQFLPDRLRKSPEAEKEGSGIPYNRSANYVKRFMDPDPLASILPPLKAIDIKQPDGPSFVINGNEVIWHRFKFRHSFNYREGLVLHDIVWYEPPTSNSTDPVTIRQIMYRASVNEMVVPYGDPRAPYPTKCAFDAGEDGLGNNTNSLKLGCDCVGDIKYFDAILSDSSGKPFTIKNAICMHEEDFGLLWKHTDFRTPDKPESRRNRRLVVSFVATVVNYEYGFYWYFYLDGTIQLEVKATGIVSTAPLPSSDEPKKYGIITDDVSSQIHQHLFSARLDFMVDGLNNTVKEVETTGLKIDKVTNPYGNAMVLKETTLTSELQARRHANPLRARFWKVYGPKEGETETRKPAWKLVPTSCVDLLIDDESPIARRGAFTKYHLWVTPHNEKEQYAAGFYVNQTLDTQGLNVWTDADRNIENKDVVLWHTFGVTHVPRHEDWPIMPVEMCGFTLKPCGFFERNPTLHLRR